MLFFLSMFLLSGLVTSSLLANFPLAQKTETIYLGSIDYAPSSTKMTAKALRQLAILAAELQEKTVKGVQLIGYANKGRSDLALARAEDVAKALKNFQIPTNKIVISTNNSHPKNNSKVDILIEKKTTPPNQLPFFTTLAFFLVGLPFLLLLALILWGQNHW